MRFLHFHVTNLIQTNNIRFDIVSHECFAFKLILLTHVEDLPINEDDILVKCIHSMYSILALGALHKRFIDTTKSINITFMCTKYVFDSNINLLFNDELEHSSH